MCPQEAYVQHPSPRRNVSPYVQHPSPRRNVSPMQPKVRPPCVQKFPTAELLDFHSYYFGIDSRKSVYFARACPLYTTRSVCSAPFTSAKRDSNAMQSAPSRPCFCVQKFPTACSLLPPFLPGQRDTLSKMGRMMLLFALIGVATGQSSCDSFSACYSWVHGKLPCHDLTMLIRVQYAILQRKYRG